MEKANRYFSRRCIFYTEIRISQFEWSNKRHLQIARLNIFLVHGVLLIYDIDRIQWEKYFANDFISRVPVECEYNEVKDRALQK